MVALLNIFLPQYLLEYATISYILVSLIEGVFINYGLRKKPIDKFGFLLAAGINFLSTIVGIYTGLASNDPLVAVIVAFFGSIIIECLFAFLYFNGKKNPVNGRVYLFIVLGNVITYILIWLTLPMMF